MFASNLPLKPLLFYNGPVKIYRIPSPGFREKFPENLPPIFARKKSSPLRNGSKFMGYPGRQGAKTFISKGIRGGWGLFSKKIGEGRILFYYKIWKSFSKITLVIYYAVLRLFLEEMKKGGKEFFSKKIRGRRHFQLKKEAKTFSGGEDFFSTKYKGGEDFFQATFFQSSTLIPGKFWAVLSFSEKKIERKKGAEDFFD